MANRKMYFKHNSPADDRGNVESSSPKRTINAFANDGSFLAMFKKKMEEKAENVDEDKATSDKPKSDLVGQNESTLTSDVSAGLQESDACGSSAQNSLQPKKPSILSSVGKRRGGKVLPTGMVKKAKKSEEEEFQSFLKKNDRKPDASDAWSQYMAEVKRYKERSCEDEGKTRPLVK